MSESREALRGSSSRRYVIWVLLCALLVAGSTVLPYLFAYATTPSGMQFGGILVNPQDGYSYLAKMQQGAAGEWTFGLSYTSEDHERGLIFTFYLALGRLSSVLGLPLILTYHLARLVAGTCLLVAVFYTALTIFRRADMAWACFGIAALSSGAGWLTTLFGYLPADMLIPESITYYAIFANPHFPLAIGLLTLSLLAMLQAVERRQVRYALLAGLLTLVQAFVQPFLVVTVYVVSFVWLASRWVGLRRLVREEAGYLGLLVGLSIPGIVNDYVALFMNPVLREWSFQNLTPSPPPYDFLLGYGLLALVASLGVAYLWRSAKPAMVSVEARRLLLVWLVVTLVLLYLPFSLQRRMVAGLHIVLSLLAVVGYFGYVAPRLAGSWWRGRVRSDMQNLSYDPAGRGETGRGLLSLILIALVPSNIFLLAITALGAGSQPYPLFLTDGEVAAFRWLGENTSPLDTVLSSETTGNIVPALAGNRVFYGHPFETINAVEKQAVLHRFFAGEMSEKEERLFLSQYGIRLVYYGRSERELGSLDPTVRPFLERVFGNDDAAIYRVDVGRLGSASRQNAKAPRLDSWSRELSWL